jgi:hypothetical protein
MEWKDVTALEPRNVWFLRFRSDCGGGAARFFASSIERTI